MNYVILGFFVVLLFSKLNIFLGLFQQTHYHISKFRKIFLKQYYLKISNYLEYSCLLCLLLYTKQPFWYVGVGVSFLALGSFMIMDPLIIKLKITKRVIRLLVTYIILNILPLIVLSNHLLIFLIEIIIMPFLIVFSAIINHQLEKMINQKYQKKSTEKLKKINPLIIGITGSYGKTSTKNFIYHLVKDKYLSYKTPSSYNTPMGISKCVNEEMKDFTELFICEMGACKKGDILELVNMLNLEIGIITEIGPQHLETFGSIEEVLKTKLEILNCLTLKYLIINDDNESLHSYPYPEHLQIIRVGTLHKASFQARNISLTKKGINFEVYYQGQKYLELSTSLLGRHNISNLLCAIAAAYLLEISPEKIKQEIAMLKPVHNRLSLREEGNILFIDDAFNANIRGFMNALEVLSLGSGTKIIITPGIVDGGALMKELNYKIAEEMIKVDSKVYLVRNEAANYIYDYFEEHQYKNYYLFNSFLDAQQNIINTYKNEVVTVLIENDLPDSYLRR